MEISVTRLALFLSLCIHTPAETQGFLITPSTTGCSGAFPPVFDFQERVLLPKAMNRTEFMDRVNGTVYHSLAIIANPNPSEDLRPFATEVVHEQMRWTLNDDGFISREDVFRPKLGVPCTGGHDNNFRFISNTEAVMERTINGTTRRDYLFSSHESYLIQYVCEDTSTIQNNRCGRDHMSIEYYSMDDVPNALSWHFLSADLASIMLTPDDKRSRWMYLDDRCPNALT